MSSLDIQTPDGVMGSYIAEPDTKPAAAIVVIQEIFGVNAFMRAKCDEMAAHGFLAVCPDLFWRLEPGIDLTDKTEAEWEKAFGYMKAFDIDQGIKDIAATIDTIRGHEMCTGKVGAMGYCLGGKLAYLTATRTDIDASIGYYGVMLETLLGEKEAIKNPLMLHIAEEDEYVSKEAQSQIKQGLEDHPQVTIHSYPGMDHAFSRIGGVHYNEEAAKLANGRSFEFLRQNLSS